MFFKAERYGLTQIYIFAMTLPKMMTEKRKWGKKKGRGKREKEGGKGQNRGRKTKRDKKNKWMDFRNVHSK